MSAPMRVAEWYAFSLNGGLKKPVLHLLAAVSSLQMSEQNCILPPLALR